MCRLTIIVKCGFVEYFVSMFVFSGNLCIGLVERILGFAVGQGPPKYLLLLTLDGGVLLGSGLLLETRDRIRLRKPGRCGFEASLGLVSE